MSNPELDLVLERTVDIPPALVWRAWTQPEHLVHWFTPKPWRTIECELELRPGGRFRTVMRGPDGQQFDNVGCFLEIVPERRLVWTAALAPEFRPRMLGADELPFTAVITLEALGKGTRYTATAIHADQAGRDRHEAMGFVEGWGKALEQLVEHMRALA